MIPMVMSEETVREIAADPDAPGDLGSRAQKALAEAEERRAKGEKIIFVFVGNDLFALNKVYESSVI